MAKTNSFKNARITPRMFHDIRTDPNVRISQTPFGEPAGDPDNYVGAAAPWKGVTGAAFWDIADKYEGEEGVGLGTALKKAISISQECEGVTGVTVKGGRVLPKKVVCQMEKAGR